MTTARKKRRKGQGRGRGICGNPNCSEPKAPDAYLCEEHRDQIHALSDRHAADPLLTYNQRSANPNRITREGAVDDGKKKRAPRIPVCCFPGCYEPRVPPDTYCDAHAGETYYD